MIKIKELREMTRPEVEHKLREQQDALFNLKVRNSAQQVPSPIQIRHTRRAVAMIKTVLNEDAKGIRKLASGTIAKNQE